MRPRPNMGPPQIRPPRCSSKYAAARGAGRHCSRVTPPTTSARIASLFMIRSLRTEEFDRLAHGRDSHGFADPAGGLALSFTYKPTRIVVFGNEFCSA